MNRLCPLALFLFACSGGGSSSSSSPTFETGGVDTGTSATGETAADTGTPTTCEVVARDGTTRDCLDDVVFCDESPENAPMLNECDVCLGGGFGGYITAWLENRGLEMTAYPDIYDICVTVSLPSRPETCSPHTSGPPSEALEPLLLPYGALWSDDEVTCRWQPIGNYQTKLPLPARLTSAKEVEPYVSCFLRADSTTVPMPAEALEGIDLATHDLYLRDTYGAYTVGLYDDGLVVDIGCGGRSPLPPQVELDPYLVDKAEPAFVEVGCRLSTCSANVRGAPLPE